MNFDFHNRNHPLDTDSYSDNDMYEMRGGNNNTNLNKPNGGFPPIYLCAQKTQQEEKTDDKTKREYKTHKTAISIKSILEQRRKVTPFVQHK